MDRALFAPGLAHPAAGEPARRGRWVVPLFWRLMAANLVVVLGGAVVGTWMTEQLVLRQAFTPLTHLGIVLVALGVSALLSMVVLRETIRPIRALRDAIHQFNTGDRSARAPVESLDDPDMAALALEMNALWDRLEADAATIHEQHERAERLATRVISAQEEERRRVARELHDEAGQALTALIIGLERGLATMPESYARDLPVQPRQMVSDLRDLAVATLEEVRNLAHELRPTVLDDLGLVAALRQYLRSVEERTGLSLRFQTSGLDEAPSRLPPAVETALFRIAQESITNAVRHAHPSQVQVRLRRAADAVSLEVRDDGVGFSALDGPDSGRHFGLFGMRERARLLAGRVDVSNVSPRGTLVQAQIPLDPVRR